MGPARNAFGRPSSAGPVRVIRVLKLLGLLRLLGHVLSCPSRSLCLTLRVCCGLPCDFETLHYSFTAAHEDKDENEDEDEGDANDGDVDR